MKGIIKVALFYCLCANNGMASDNLTELDKKNLMRLLTGYYLELQEVSEADTHNRKFNLEKIQDALNINNNFDDICRDNPLTKYAEILVGEYNSSFWDVLNIVFFQFLIDGFKHKTFTLPSTSLKMLRLVPEILKDKKVMVNPSGHYYRSILATYIFFYKYITQFISKTTSETLFQELESCLNSFKNYHLISYDETSTILSENWDFFAYNIPNDTNQIPFINTALKYFFLLILPFELNSLDSPIHVLLKTDLGYNIHTIFNTQNLFEIKNPDKVAKLIVNQQWDNLGETSFIGAINFFNKNIDIKNYDFKIHFTNEVYKRIQTDEAKNKMLEDIFNTKGKLSDNAILIAIDNLKKFLDDPDFSKKILKTFCSNIKNDYHYNFLKKLLSVGINPQKIQVSDLENQPFSRLALQQYKLSLNSIGLTHKINPDNPSSDIRWKYLPNKIKRSLVYVYLVLHKEFKIPKDVVRYIFARTPVQMDDWFKK